jgi:hypothetical protein
VAIVTITRIGANQKYSDGWEAAFGGRKRAAKPAAKKKSPKRAGKKAKR